MDSASMWQSAEDSADQSDRRLTLFQRILLGTDGTVTDLIREYSGETIRVHKLGQTLEVERAPETLACADPTALLRRTILLCGDRRTYLFADSVFVFDRLPTKIQEQLLHTDRPIGLLWQEQRLETYREIVDRRIEPCPEIAAHFSISESEPCASRTYLVYQAGRPMGLITEKWPLRFFDGGDALTARSQALGGPAPAARRAPADER